MYQKERFQEHSKCKQIYLNVIFTCLGLIIMPVMDLFIKIEALINVLMLPFSCRRKGSPPLNFQIQRKLKKIFEDSFDINPYELENYQK